LVCVAGVTGIALVFHFFAMAYFALDMLRSLIHRTIYPLFSNSITIEDRVK
jgi:hypothetical protein